MNRKQFIFKAMAGGAVASFMPTLLKDVKAGTVRHNQESSPLRIALIGCGSQGSGDTRTALQVEGVKLVAVCDLYDARIQHSLKEWGNDLFRTKDYHDILERKDVDAVIIGTPDHWHKTISIEAMKAGKHVYCEKPVIHHLSEGKALIDAQRETGRCFQTGSQGMASIGNRKAKQLLEAGSIGKVHLVEGVFTAAPGMLNGFKAPADANEQTIWWKQFIGDAPMRPFDAQRFFCWRNWADYSTGLCGDLFVHVLTSIHYITSADGPSKVYATGGIDYYTDGSRDMPDIMLGCLDYPDKKGLGKFTVALTANYSDGVSKKWGSMDFKIIGEKGVMDVGWDKVTLTTQNSVEPTSFDKLPALGKSIDSPVKTANSTLVFQENGYSSCHFDHFSNFFKAIRTGTLNEGNVRFAVQTAAPAVLCYESYTKAKPVYWDPIAFKQLRKPTV